MTFTTPAFLAFLALVFLSYWSLRRGGQNVLILTASLWFYGWWDWRFLFLLGFSAGVDFWVALKLMSVEDSRSRRFWLIVSLATNLGLLGFFKYYNFFAESLTQAIRQFGGHVEPATLQLILPVGISFYTFQALSYTIDVYRRRIPAVSDPIAYFSFISFFPHMVAGPIQPAKHFLTQFERDRVFDRNQAIDGARQMLWGFFKKMVVADNLAPLVNAAYDNPASMDGWMLLLATYCFALQIYCDFSGYTDIAIGCARMFGLHMTRNFAYPYFARSIPEFWRRWHISLSQWFRDYLYIPLGGNRVSPWKRARNVLIVFAVSGFWHGAAWTFLIWGTLHGLFFLAYEWLSPPRERESASGQGQGHTQSQSQSRTSVDIEGIEPPMGSGLWPGWRNLGLLLVNFHLVCLCWVFFRASSVPEAWLILQKIGQSVASGSYTHPGGLVAGGLAATLFAVDWLGRRHPHPLAASTSWPRPARLAAYYVIIVAIILFGDVHHQPFIYFQF